jgi:hypothetical protein
VPFFNFRAKSKQQSLQYRWRQYYHFLRETLPNGRMAGKRSPSPTQIRRNCVKCVWPVTLCIALVVIFQHVIPHIIINVPFANKCWIFGAEFMKGVYVGPQYCALGYQVHFVTRGRIALEYREDENGSVNWVLNEMKSFAQHFIEIISQDE